MRPICASRRIIIESPRSFGCNPVITTTHRGSYIRIQGRVRMSAGAIDRRSFLSGSAASLVLGFSLPALAQKNSGGAAARALNAWVRIGTDDTVTLILSQCEIGAIFGLTSALKSEITFEKGRAVQSNFDGYDVVPLWEAPPRVDTFLRGQELIAARCASRLSTSVKS
jgi:hypothetical protein